MPQDTPTHALSGGEQQRLALAGALALEPTVLLLDEPTAMLDPVNAASVRATVGEVGDARRLTTVVVEHRLGPWLDFADRLVVLDAAGAVVADGEPRDVLAEHGESLAAQGIWVPGIPAPQPRGIPAGHVRAGRRSGPTWSRWTRPSVTIARRVRAARRLDPDARRRSRTRRCRRAPARSTRWSAPSGVGQVHARARAGRAARPEAGAVRAHPTWRRSPAPAARATRASWDTTTSPGRWPGCRSGRARRWWPHGARRGDDHVAGPRAGRVRGARAGPLLLDVSGLAHLDQADPRHLSGGEQRRLAMASAVVHQPAVLLADEATVGQDRLTWAAVMGIVEELRDAGSAIVLTTHDDAVVARADRRTTIDPARSAAARARPRRPLVARCGPLSLLAARALAIPAGVLSPHWSTSLLVLARAGGARTGRPVGPVPGRRHGAPLRRPRPAVLLRMLPGLLGALSVAWSTWLLGGHDLATAFTAGLRVLIIVLPSAVLIRYVDADALGDHLGQRLRLPARPVVALAAALQRVHTFGDIWTEIARARRVRGIGATARSPRSVLAELWALTIGILVRSLQAAATLAVAMDARGFATAYRRTWAAPAPVARCGLAGRRGQPAAGGRGGRLALTGCRPGLVRAWVTGAR